MCKRAATFLGITLIVLLASPAGGQQPALTADDLFGSTDLQRLDLFVHSSDWAKLKANFRENTYYPADVTWNGQSVRNVGIRSRGLGSRSGTKPGLRVDFDRYNAGQTFLGLKSFVLDNLTQDASGIHETASAAFYARLGIPVSREIHTRLFINNEYAGLYVIVESVDKDLLARIFGVIGEDTQNDGYLYEYNWEDEWRLSYLGSVLSPYKLKFSATTHESKTDEELYRRIETLVRLINQSSTVGLPNEIGNLFDIPGFVRFVAAQNFLAETDGFLGAFGLNNFYLYRLENQEKHVLISWDSDNTFYSPILSINEGWGGNVLMEKLMSLPEYNQMYRDEIARAAQLAEEDDWLNTEIIRQIQRIDTAMKEDTAKPWTNGQYEGEAGEMLNYARTRISFVRCELERGAGNISCRP
ncbi:MAG TPA: CotH kinase family protein [Vicinamibacterales bacterium]|nr:CotH kinase family protein [Vicinamibacterales bacterium]